VGPVISPSALVELELEKVVGLSTVVGLEAMLEVVADDTAIVTDDSKLERAVSELLELESLVIVPLLVVALPVADGPVVADPVVALLMAVVVVEAGNAALLDCVVLLVCVSLLD
jgi:hypothetical protein